MGNHVFVEKDALSPELPLSNTRYRASHLTTTNLISYCCVVFAKESRTTERCRHVQVLASARALTAGGQTRALVGGDATFEGIEDDIDR